ncbi:hypothetical protein MIN45_P2073 [Methylomarinovum tepidoasis]|uniref:Uncharacterized protein n=1 Tax=Methylomarinovum tepidoasis TaxID=2840183 RepID=A0AAU9CAZ7_9GAMM|nr:hypothetical protein [Methylomarinovum sp. IN45]BCX89700.1 hypothetical protein MIN45_P2073 [Methylomarinovum sp. IN45]
MILATWLLTGWLLGVSALFLWKRRLFLATWREPYFSDLPLVIESDDWGPGDESDGARLTALLTMLARHRDRTGRTAVLTPNMVLAVPDAPRIVHEKGERYHRRFLDDLQFRKIHEAIRHGIRNGRLVPQLHGLEHCHGEGLVVLYREGDPRVKKIFESPRWWDWERLDPPLQGHYVDGTRLPTRPLPKAQIDTLVAEATDQFQRLFGQPSRTSVAPCYLWNDDVEAAWHRHGITAIQTAGYRCDRREADGSYHQDKPLLRPGNTNHLGQRYLVRNVMYEPADGAHTPETALTEIRQAWRQALPAVISTHRYNFTRDQARFRTALDGLDQILRQAARWPLRFLSSPELADAIAGTATLENRFTGERFPGLTHLKGWAKIPPFLQRLRYRHPKLVLLAWVTGLALPAWAILWTGGRR